MHLCLPFRLLQNEFVLVGDVGLPIYPLPLMIWRVLARHDFCLLNYVVGLIQIETEKLIKLAQRISDDPSSPVLTQLGDVFVWVRIRQKLSLNVSPES